MKYSILLFCLFCFQLFCFAQNPPVAGYKLWVNPTSFISGTVYTPAVWKDLSTSRNNLSANLFYGSNPSLTTYLQKPAIYFHGNSILQNDSLNNTLSDTAATVFMVTNAMSSWASISIAEDASVDNEFVIENNNVYHHSSASNWIGKDLTCAPKSEGIMILTGAWNAGATKGEVASYFNGSPSFNPTTIGGADMDGQMGYPSTFTQTNRRIYLGGRMQNGYIYSGHQYEGYIYEVIVYNRRLSESEIAAVNNYLKEKTGGETLQSCKQTGINDSKNDLLSIFPNPVQNTLTISQENKLMESIKVSDVTGRIVYEKEISNSTNESKIDVSTWANGLYILTILNTNNQLKTSRFLKTD